MLHSFSKIDFHPPFSRNSSILPHRLSVSLPHTRTHAHAHTDRSTISTAMLMVQQRRSCNNAKTSRKNETVADSAQSAVLIRSLMQPKHKHYQKDNGTVATLLSGSNERWKLVAPCFLPGYLSCGNYLGTGGQLEINEFPADSPWVILFPVDQQEGKMINPTCTNSLMSSSLSRRKCIGHNRNRSKRSKTVKGFSHQLLNNCILPDKPLDFLCSNSTLENPDNLGDGKSKASETVKTNSKKKGKKKGRQRKKPPHNKDCVTEGAACETGFLVLPAIETSHSTIYDSPMVSDNISAPLAYTFHSDGMEESEPRGSSFDESACSSSICDQPSPIEDSSHQTSFSKEMEAHEVALSPFDENSTNADDSKASSTCDTCSGYCSGQDKSPISVSFLDEWASDIGCDPGKFSVENVSDCQDQNDLQASECQMFVRSFGSSCVLGSSTSVWCNKNVGNNDDGGNGLIYQQKIHNSMPNVAERSGHLNENKSCDISGLCQSSVPKRRRHGRESCANSNFSCRFGAQNTHSKMRRDTGHPVWQRVQSKGVERCTEQQHGPNVASDSDVVKELDGRSRSDAILLHQSSDKMTSCRHLNLDKKASYSDVYRSDNRGCTPNRVDSKFRKVAHMIDKELMNPVLVSEGNETESSRMCPVNGKIKTCRPPKVPLQDKNAVNKSSVGSQEQQNLIKNNHPKTVSSSKCGLNSFPLNSLRARRSCFSRTTLHNVPQCSVKGGNAETMHNQMELASSISNSSVQRSVLESQCDKTSGNLSRTEMQDICHPASSSTKSDMTSEATASYIESGNYDHLSGSPRQKWVPVGKKDSYMVANCPCDLVFNKEYHRSIGENVIQKSNSKIAPLAREEDDMETNLLEKPPHVSGERNGVCVATDGSSTSKESMPFLCTLDTDLEKIIRAVTDAHGLQSASEVVHLQTGCPLAEFEKVLHCASPVICQIPTLPSCRSCSPDRILGNSLYSHRIPNISLKNLWQWYEKHGSYGLEVKVEDQHANRLGSRSKFRAYFVPYLSAVQLFGQSKHRIPTDSSISKDLENVSLESDDLENFSESEKLSKCVSRLTTFPIFSILLSQPRQGTPAEIHEHSSSSTKVGKWNLPASGAEDDGRLLFEYFESDPPQQRPPLFEKIKMLVRGDRSLNSQTFGDPSYLECLHLHEIGPASWFSVAWYPIYRIPDGSLRAAFLTYHCLGSFTHRSNEVKHDHATHIVCPVVGLQSYNSRGECWFQLGDCKPNSIKIEDPSSNPSQILKERLRTLNQTATTMARASVRKHGQKSVNVQPDYEFFVSRAW